MKSYYIDDIEAKKQKLIKSRTSKPLIDAAIARADEAITETSPAFKMSDYLMFYENGNRSVFEKRYFQRRNKCAAIMIAYWITEDDKYLIPLIDYISYICDEFTWCLPAHADFLKRKSASTIEHVDLFQAETARLFAEIMMCLQEKLPAYIKDRMEYEIRRRIFSTFEKESFVERYTPQIHIDNKYHWEDCKMNWATVCGCGVTMAALAFGTDEEKEKYIKRLIGCLDSYLEGIEDDGCCQEGVSYWGYGFGHFVILAQAIKIYTNDSVDYFKNPKVKALALYPQKVRMSESMVASFSDSTEKFKFKTGLVCFLKSIYPEVNLPDIKYGITSGNVDSLWEILWLDDEYKSDKRELGTRYFEQSQWYLNAKDNFCFAAKGGHNNEPHNHNDIGSFMITSGDEVFISDLGCGEYTKDTFTEGVRYTLLQNSSRGHSVPIINGTYQTDGIQYRALNVSVTQDGFELDIEGAYEDGLINKLRRSFTVTDEKIILKDTAAYSDKTKNLTERFITKNKPTVSDGKVDCTNGTIIYDKDKFDVEVNIETFVAHNAKDVVTVYEIDFIPKCAADREFQFEFVPMK